MKKKQRCYKYLILIFLGLAGLNGMAQKSSKLKLGFNTLRGDNVVDMAFGTAVPNGDYSNPMFEIYMHFGYKRYVVPHLNINFSYNKFNIAFKDAFNEGYMSFDVNLEGTIFPDKKFTPYVFVGGGVNASNYFEQSEAKAQGGLGVEYLISDKIGIKLFSDYNLLFSDELDGRIYGNSDDVYWRMALGLNYYFGGSKRKVKTDRNEPTIINSNPIINN
ncbi:Curli production assembly/transport component CsgG [Xanthomarina sp. GH4-25]|uniref:Curli production assembly/transport component CsgG n=1 Tax=Xanthomarina sp. GH4-25 TaxID=3349335 RepID=UPI003877B10A